MELWFLYILLVTMSAAYSQMTYSRISVGSCSPVEGSDLGSNTSLSTEGIVPATFRIVDGRDAPMVQILRHQIVCEVAGRLKNTVGLISVLVEYQCLGYACPGYNRNNHSNPVTATSQFQIHCQNTNTFLLIFLWSCLKHYWCHTC